MRLCLQIDKVDPAVPHQSLDDCNLRRYPKPKSPKQATPKFLTQGNRKNKFLLYQTTNFWSTLLHSSGYLIATPPSHQKNLLLQSSPSQVIHLLRLKALESTTMTLLLHSTTNPIANYVGSTGVLHLSAETTNDKTPHQSNL